MHGELDCIRDSRMGERDGSSSVAGLSRSISWALSCGTKARSLGQAEKKESAAAELIAAWRLRDVVGGQRYPRRSCRMSSGKSRSLVFDVGELGLVRRRRLGAGGFETGELTFAWLDGRRLDRRWRAGTAQHMTEAKESVQCDTMRCARSTLRVSASA